MPQRQTMIQPRCRINGFHRLHGTRHLEILMMTKKDKGHEQLSIVYDAVLSLGEASTLKAIYEACRKNFSFGIIFDCKNPDARIRTILQRNSKDAMQFAIF